MTTQEVANRLVEVCRTGDFEAAQKELFSNDIVSIEPHSTPDFEKETKGLDAVLEKGEKWKNMVSKVSKMTVSDPVVAGNSFACTMYMDVTMKNGQQMVMTELCVYNVKDGKIVSEIFMM